MGQIKNIKNDFPLKTKFFMSKTVFDIKFKY